MTTPVAVEKPEMTKIITVKLAKPAAVAKPSVVLNMMTVVKPTANKPTAVCNPVLVVKPTHKVKPMWRMLPKPVNIPEVF